MAETAAQPHRAGGGRKALVWAGAGLVALLVLVAALLLAADTGAGHRVLRRALADFAPQNGLQVRVGEIEGSIYGRMTLHDLELRDPRGVFLTSPSVTLDWRPAAFLLQNRLEVRELTSPEIRVLRRPELKPTPKRDKTLLPSFDVHVGRLALDRIILEAPVVGGRQLASLSGRVDIRAGRLRTDLLAGARPEDGAGGGDVISAHVDAQPDANRLLIDVRVTAPAGGVLAGLAGLDRPLAAEVGGRGTWASWTGQARVRLGDETLARLGLAARSGRFAVRGRVRPALMLDGAASRLLQPAVSVELDAAVGMGRRVDGRLGLASSALTLAADGRIDLRRSRFDDLAVQARLLRPAALSPQIRGQGVRLEARLDGPFSRPDVRYDLAAAQLAFGDTTLHDLAARGRFRVGRERTVAPVHATIGRVTGLDEAVAGVARGMRIDGEVVVTPEQVATDSLRLRSDTLDARLVASLSFRTGTYVAALKGAINRFEQPGVGVFDVVTDARLSSRDGGLSLGGRLEARSRRIDNNALRDLLGGQMTATAAFERTAEGAIGVTDLTVSAPALRVTNGRGRIGPDGSLAFAAVAQSERYGRVELAASGSTGSPVIRIKAENPRLGVPLSDVELVLRRGPQGYALAATGSSPYGPLSADAIVTTRGGPLGLEIRQAALAGVNVSGRVTQTPSGPFAGLLRVSGSGLEGDLRLSAAGRVQRLDAQVLARNARLPLAPPVLITAGAARATALLYPGKPAITAQARLRGVRRDRLVVEAATAQLAYDNGRGSLDLTAEGSSGAPFSVQARAALSPRLIAANAKGRVGGTAFRLEEPARLRRADRGWELRPTRVLLDKGQVELSGRLGAAGSISARLRSVDLGLSRAFAPELGLDGLASGDLEVSLASGDIPTVRADLQIKGLSRSGLVSSGAPVDVVLVADLASGGGRANALIRRRGEVVGRLKAELGAPPAGAGSWRERLARAPLSGGLRYNGPAAVPWSFTGIAGQTLTGPVAVGVDFRGRLSDPQLAGVVRAQALRYENQDYGTVVSDLAVEGRLAGSRLELSRVAGRAGAGTIAGSGYIDLSADRGYPMDLRLQLRRAALADSDNLGAVLTGDIAITNARGPGARISGRAVVEQARYRIARSGVAEVPELTGVRRGPRSPAPPQGAAAGSGDFPGLWRLDIAVQGDNRIFVSGMGLESEWRTSLRITGSADEPRIVGEARAVRGGYTFAGRRFELSRGVIRFNGGSPIDPVIDIAATTTVEGVAAAINVTGRATDPQIAFTSTPALPQDEVLARLLFGDSTAQLSAGQALQLAASLNALRGGGAGNPLGALRQATGVDRLRFLGADEAGGRGAALAAGKYISNDVYVEVTTDARGFTAVQIEVALSKTLSVLSQAGAFGSSNVNLRYRRDY